MPFLGFLELKDWLQRAVSTTEGWKGNLGTGKNALTTCIFVPSSGKKGEGYRNSIYRKPVCFTPFVLLLYLCTLLLPGLFSDTKIFYFGRIRTHLSAFMKHIPYSRELCSLFVHAKIFFFAGCSLLTLRKWMRSQPAHPGAPRCLLGSWCRSSGAQAAGGGCTASASPPAATAWPGSVMTAPCQWLMPPKTWCEYPLAGIVSLMSLKVFSNLNESVILRGILCSQACASVSCFTIDFRSIFEAYLNINTL